MKKQTLFSGLFLLYPLLLTACGDKNVDTCDPSKFDCTPVCDNTKFDCTPKNEITSSAAVVDNDKANIAKLETDNLYQDKPANEEKKEAPAAIRPEEVKKIQSAKKQEESDASQKSFDDAKKAVKRKIDQYYTYYLSQNTDGLFDYLGYSKVKVKSQTNEIVYLTYTIELMRGGNESTFRDCDLRGEYNVNTGSVKFEAVSESCLW
jgi:hypothetical protein